MIRQLSSRIVYRNRWMVVREDDVVFANGQRGIYTVVEKVDFALIIPYEAGLFYLVRQYRYPVEGSYWEFPMGATEKEASLAAEAVARRELQEEAGLRAGHIERIGFLYEAYGYSNQGFNVFLATDLRKGKQDLEVSEAGMEVGAFSIAQFKSMVENGAIRDAPTVSAYGLLCIKNLL